MSRPMNTSIIVKTPPSKTAMFVDFEVKREGWNLYSIGDGTLLRTKFVLTGVLLDSKPDDLVRQIKPGQKMKLGFGFRSRYISSAEPPIELRGEPDSRKYSTAELKSSIVDEDLDFETIRETWNLYELENGIVLKVRQSPVTVNRTSKFDNGGMPIYTVDSNADMKVELPEHMRKLLEEKTKSRARKGKAN